VAFQDFPTTFSAGASGLEAARYRKAEGLFAVHGGAGTPNLPVELTIEDPPVAVYRGEPEAAGLGASEDVTPVYLAPGGSPGVPTGLVFVRFRAGTEAASRAAPLSNAGFEIESVPGYAPHACWVRARSGRMADAIKNIMALLEIDGVELVEPQLLMAVGRR
jgi:hypothetical protein